MFFQKKHRTIAEDDEEILRNRNHRSMRIYQKATLDEFQIRCPSDPLSLCTVTWFCGCLLLFKARIELVLD
jgi:hypothetical protein